MRLPPATLLVVLCHSRREAEAALAALRSILAELGLELKQAKSRIVHLREGGEGTDFLGFHHRHVRLTGRRRHIHFLARWPSTEAMAHARARIREITDRKRLRLPVEWTVQDLNRFLRGWGGYFRYGHSAHHFDQISNYAVHRRRGSWPNAIAARSATDCWSWPHGRRTTSR